MKSAVGDSLMTPFPRLAYLMEQILTWSNKHLKPQDCASNQVQATNRVVWCQNAVDPESRMKSAIGVSLMTPFPAPAYLLSWNRSVCLFGCTDPSQDPRSRVPLMTPLSQPTFSRGTDTDLFVCLFVCTDPRSSVPLMTPFPFETYISSCKRYPPGQTNIAMLSQCCWSRIEDKKCRRRPSNDHLLPTLPSPMEQTLTCLFMCMHWPKIQSPSYDPLPHSQPTFYHRFVIFLVKQTFNTTWLCIISSTLFALSGALCITMQHHPSIGTFHPAQTPVSQYLL